MFQGVHAFFVEGGVHRARIQVWKRKVAQLGGEVAASPTAARVTHVLAADWRRVQQVTTWQAPLPGVTAVEFAWIENSLKHGSRLPETKFLLCPSSARLQKGETTRTSQISASATGSGDAGDLTRSPERIRNGHVVTAVDSTGIEDRKGKRGGQENGRKEEGKDEENSEFTWKSLGGKVGGEEVESDEEGGGEATAGSAAQAGRQDLELSEEEKAFWMEVIFESAAWGAVEGEEEGGGVGRSAGEGMGVSGDGEEGGEEEGEGGSGGMEGEEVLGHTRGLCVTREGERGVDAQGGSAVERDGESSERDQGERAGREEREKGSSRDEEGEGRGNRADSQWSVGSQLPSADSQQADSQAGACGYVDAYSQPQQEGSQQQWQSQSQSQQRDLKQHHELPSLQALSQEPAASTVSAAPPSAADPAPAASVEPAPVAPPPQHRLQARVLLPGLYLPPNLNARICQQLTELKNIYKDGLGDEWRWFSYYKALSVLEKLPFRIRSAQQVHGLPSIGSSLQGKIHEILSYGIIKKLRAFQADEMVRTLALFGTVWGVGPTTARRFYSAGHRTLRQLAGDPSLTPAQQIALRFHADINTRIPRDDVAVMESLVRREGVAVQAGISIICGGSYRRGKASAGDMDFIITHPDGASHRGFLERLVSRLKRVGFVTEDLVVGTHHSKQPQGEGKGVDTYFGLCKQAGREQRHRIDFKVYPWAQYPFGLIQWTGNDVLNRRMRLFAEAKGYRLDDHGLVLRDAPPGTTAAKSVPCKTERDVFDFLGLPWLEPHERNL
ncbi:hypothetical protein CLOM_g4195 [Closterium sp. NIES-68]|nr:hypothetical protein CLOM_g4195 [Closterium sp. NIES-68]